MTRTQVVKVFTPIKRVPMVIGKAQNGQKLPFGPYTLPQVAGVAIGLLITSALAMSLPANPAITFLVGLAFTVAVGFALGLIPYTGVRLSSRILWVGRLVLDPKPVSASGMPISAESARLTSFIEETVVLILPDNASSGRRAQEKAESGVNPFLQLLARPRASDAPQATISSQAARVEPRSPGASTWRAMTTGSGGKADGKRERATNGARS